MPQLISHYNVLKLASKIKNKILARLYAWDLGKAYRKGLSCRATASERLERVDPRIITEGTSLRQKVIDQYHHRYQNRGYRVLFQMPSSGVGVFWFRDLIHVLQHVGIACASITRSARDNRESWLGFRPNIFVTMDQPEVLRSLDLDFINNYKKDKACLRLFTPIVTHRFPKHGLSAEDRWRLELACARRSADAFFSMMEPEFYSEFWPEWERAGIKYLPLPNACNPFRHYPVDGFKNLDYFTVTSFSFERAEVTHRYLKTIFEQYHGLWAGPGWGFGEGEIDPEKLRDYYAQSCISPSPLLNFLIEFPAEITERSFSATACGAFLITNKTPVTSRFFTPEELVCVDNEKTFLDAFRYYLDRPGERNEIILRGMRRVFHQHTYFHRIDDLIKWFDKNKELF